MTVSLPGYLKGIYDQTRAAGEKVINSDFSFEIECHESARLLAKQCPWPELAPQGEIEVPSPLGAALWQPQQMKIHQQGSITLMETTLGSADMLMKDIITAKNPIYFNAKIYEGTPQNYLRFKRIVDCFLQIEPVDRDWENRAQVLLLTGTVFYHYFGEDGVGNSKDYR
jgi:hypothetical protein